MTLREYREKYQYKLKDDVFVSYIISVPLSYILNCLFYSKKIIPNYVTFLMLCFGILGGIFFSVGNVPCMWVGYFFMHLWFAFDAWDGAVARQSKRFSKYGKEFDYVVHLLVHPILIFSISLYAINKLTQTLCLFYLCLNLVKRGLYLLEFSKNHVILASDAECVRKYPWYYYIFDFFYNAPNFILLTPILIFFNINYMYFLFPFILFDFIKIFLLVREYVFYTYLKDDAYNEKK